MTAGSVSAPLIIPIVPLQTHRTKNHIDTSTPVAIQSDTTGALTFFTLDGSKPAVGPQGSAGSSSKYTDPILLPAGRVSVRAVAVTSDGRQSSVVTKVFLVDQLGGDLQNQQQHPTDGTSGSAENSAGSSLTPAGLLMLHTGKPRMVGHSRPPSGTRFLNGRFGSRTAAASSGSSRRSQSAGNKRTTSNGRLSEEVHFDVLPVCQTSPELKQLSSTDASRVQRETDFLRCAQCLSARPSDPLARFCAQCGAVVPPLPGQRLPPAEAGQTLLCVFCNSLVPINTHTCLICEASVSQQRRPQAHRALQEHVVCVCCRSGNPAHLSSCLTCESRLQPVGQGENSAPSVLAGHSRMLTCSRCKRMNSCDARFCDWCGSKPAHAVRCVTCWRCGASGNPYAFYCTACGVFLEAPAPPTSCSDITQPVRSTGTTRAAAPSSSPAPGVKVTPPTVDQYTQTVGLYYPSANELQKKQQQKALQVCRRQPPLTAISPGRGYWRKQLDHVCAHLRSYAQNNVSFRALLGEPRLGRAVSAVIQEDGYEVSLTVSFVSAVRREQGSAHRDWDGPNRGESGPAGGTETLSSVTEQSADISSLRRDRPSAGMKPSPKSAPRPAVTDSQLLKELGPGGGRISTIQKLLDQGADPSCCQSDGRHALVVAVASGYHDVLPVLVQRGADVDQKSGPMKNTALHEAAALGSRGLRCAEVLLRCKADVRRRNATGQTAYSVAVNSGCGDMVSLLAAHTGPDLLG
ncbi:double zinc ribbon and ankyrin repeat-containing protein 1 [Leuresthes tenuis]|uniref:double zinc ribbon and ankyrin repeat-containing protein 1 n=1 Tax=Leuresthes tenuis TaxID=355514 RepID=UPI003B50CEA2